MGLRKGYSKKELRRIATGPKGNRGKVLVDPRAMIAKPKMLVKPVR